MTLARYALRSLDETTLAQVMQHVDGCAECRAASSALVMASRNGVDTELDGKPWSRPHFAPGSKLDRFIILHEIGEGASSVVYAAYDPKLDRKLALKLLRSRGASLDERLLREGRALAKVSHPNVVSVYEVGEADDQLYIALELIEGVSAAQWVAITKPRWTLVRAVFLAAARGLSALHRAGLVHHDVKPDNIVVARDGKVRLVDLGLVGAGAGAGTPLFMAPEVAVGRVGDTASDQFSLCAAFADCLGGQTAIEHPQTLRVPRRLRKAIARGLASDPRARFPNVETLIDALRPRQSWRWAVPASAIGIAATATLVLAANHMQPSMLPLCTATQLVTPAELAAVDAAIATSTRPHAIETRQRVTPALTGYADAWRTEHQTACEAYHARREISANRFDRRIDCLARHRLRFEATITRIKHGGPEAIDRAIDLIAALPSVAECHDDGALDRSDPLPVDATLRIASMTAEQELAAAQVSHDAGDSKLALDHARTALDAARSSEYRPTIARAALMAGELLVNAGSFEQARSMIDEAIQTAAAGRADLIEARGWILALYLLGVEREAKESELTAATLAARAAVARAGDPIVHARLENVLGAIAKRSGDYERAREHLQASLDVLTKAGAHGTDLSITQGNLSTVLPMLGDLAGARQLAAQAVRRDREMFGPHHPRYAESLVQLAPREADAGEHEVARAHLEEALAIANATYGADSVPAMEVHQTAALLLGRNGELDAAQVHAQRGLELSRKLRGPNHSDTAKALLTIANLAASRGEFGDAERIARQALAIIRDSAGPDHPLVASITANLGMWALERGDARTAERALRAGLATMARFPANPYSTAMRTTLADALIAQGRRREAIALYEAVVVQHVELDDDPMLLAEARYRLAKALWPTKRRRALELARQAAAAFAAAGKPGDELANDLKQWAARARVPIEGA
ncbi:MAG: tetratricopeptide repeat protein [Kofleriaceae bacterium]